MSGVEGLDNLSYGLSCWPYCSKISRTHRSSFQINMKPSFFIYTVAKSWITAVAQALLGIDVHTPANLLGKLC